MKNNSHYKLLLLSGGSLVGQNIVASLTKWRNKLSLFGLNSIAEEPSLYDFDEVFLTSETDLLNKEFIHRFKELLEIINPDLVIPCRDEDVLFLSELRHTLPSASDKFLCGEKMIANAMVNKEKSYLFSKKNNLPFAPAISSNADYETILKFIDEHKFPIIVKPKRGFASRDVFIATEKNQIEEIIGNTYFILQKYIGDTSNITDYLVNQKRRGIPLFHSFEEMKISIQAAIGPNGELGGVFVTKHKMVGGKSNIVEKYDDEDILNSANKWVEVFINKGWRGPLNIQCQEDKDGALYIYEYNGRFTGATAARVLLGMDEVEINLRLWVSEVFKNSAKTVNENKVIRYPYSRLVDSQKVKSLRRNRYWRNESGLL